MSWGWQDVATLAVIASASVYLARKFVPGLSRKRAAGCSHCPSKNGGGSCQDQPIVITLAEPRPVGGKGSGFGT